MSINNNSLFCDELNNTLSFFPDRISACCTSYIGPIYIENPNNKTIINYNIFNEKKKTYLLNLMTSNLSSCNSCFYLRNKGTNDINSLKFRKIILNHFLQCNCNCIYCARTKKKSDIVTGLIKKRSNYYDALPIIKGLYNNNLIDKENLTVLFQGGDISVLKEFDNLAKLFYKNGVNMFHIATNNIIYKPIIEEMFREHKATVISSLDCGCRETYKRIKRIDGFDIFIKNIKRYINNCKDCADLNIKYIIIPHVNDNKNEVEMFLNLMEDLHIKKISFDIDYRYINTSRKTKFIIPKHYYYLFDMFKDYSDRNNIILDINPYTQNILKEGIFDNT